jgi:hypothetical protein
VKRAALFLLWFAVPAEAQSGGTPSSSAKVEGPRPAYLQRGDEVEQRYRAHRENLEKFFAALRSQVVANAPELEPRLLPPADVPFGYQIVPNLLPDPPRTSQRSRIKLSPFSWPRTDSIIGRGRDALANLRIKLDTMDRVPGDRKSAYTPIVDEYRRLVDGQKFMASLVEYNRLWQSEIARNTPSYKVNNQLKDIAFARQALLDSIANRDENFRLSAQARIASYQGRLDEVLKKAPTPDFIHIDHASEHVWQVHVPMYTDITDSAFVERSREIIESGWHVVDGSDDFSVKLDIRRVPPSELYANTTVPAKGQHIDISAHVQRFPPNGIVFTTGANTTYVLGRAIILGPHAIPRKTLVHEFGHMLGFRDGYFRSFEDLGINGYNVVEAIFDPDDVLTTPENGKASRQHFDLILKEKAR